MNNEQFRMTRLQVYNWGTFSGMHDIPIAPEGFLFVGRSGSGKSTLLDALSALLIPPRWIDFNAAAREADRSGRDRNLVTYVRGAWAEQKDGESGEIATRYLRCGTTWSALALTYQNQKKEVVVLVQLLWLRGNANANNDIRRAFLIFERTVDIVELENFSQDDFDLRKLKQDLPEAFIRTEFRPYCDRYCNLLGINSEMALRLLHKTQSAKNLGDLNIFLRDFMLDKPETFAVADRLINEFGELNEAHLAVVTAREQVQNLKPAHDRFIVMQDLIKSRNEVEELKIGITYYRDQRYMLLLQDFIRNVSMQLHGLSGEIDQKSKIRANQVKLLHDLEQQHQDSGGAQIQQWENEKTNLEQQKTECLRRRENAAQACKMLNWTLPANPTEFAQQINDARNELENWQQQLQISRTEQFSLADQKRKAEEEFVAVTKEIHALKRQPSNIPAYMLELRSQISKALNVGEESLPFVGELIEVKPQEARWQGAIERVMHGFALSVLVDESNYNALTNYVNGTNIGQKLVYYRTDRVQTAHQKNSVANLLITKLNIKENAHTPWLQNELLNRYDYVCVDSIRSFRIMDRAITMEGQVKHNVSRHEKDDRHKIDDRRHWVLGFDNRAKLQLFENRAQELAINISQLQQEIQALATIDEQRHMRTIHCQTLINMQWQDIDIALLLDRIDVLANNLRIAIEGNKSLQALGTEITKQKTQLALIEKQLKALEIDHSKLFDQQQLRTKQLADLQLESVKIVLSDSQTKGLNLRFDNLPNKTTLDNIDKHTTVVVQSLSKDAEKIVGEIHECEKMIENQFLDFQRRWPLDASNMDATLASANDFFAKLQRLESDGLPVYEERFFELLQNQSLQNLAALSTYLNQARKEILERMILVNESLKQAQFNPGTYLHIDVNDRQLPEVREFKQDIASTLNYAWNNDRDSAEARFIILRKLVERLGSKDPMEIRWKDAVLDVRTHVEFIGREFDQQGAELEVYRSGAGKSGGQRQKLATTCLAAALRYQLGGDEHGIPKYAPVILDEAFDKADNEFTALAMNIFKNFGFQVIVATPLKSVMTLEPFIGGACFVDINDRKVSAVLLIEYDTKHSKLKLPSQAKQGITSA